MDNSEFWKAIKQHATQGFQQFYFIVAESTVKHLCGRWFYKDGNFYEAEVFQMNAYPDSGMTFGKMLNNEKLEQAISDGYVSLYRVPKNSYRKQFPEMMIF